MLKKCDGKHPESLDSVIWDYNVLGIFHGFRLCEWKQNSSDKKQRLTSTDDLPLEFIFADLIFLGVDCHAIPQLWSS